MKNPIIIFVVIVVVAVLGIGAYTMSQSSSRSDLMMKKDESLMEPSSAMMEKKDDTPKEDKMVMDDMQGESRYVEYSKSVLDSTSNGRRVLFFYASWCPSCKPADESFTQNMSKIPEDVVVIRVNYNDPETDQEEEDLAKEYGVTYQHTFVQIDSSGREVTKWNGGQIDELLSHIK